MSHFFTLVKIPGGNHPNLIIGSFPTFLKCLESVFKSAAAMDAGDYCIMREDGKEPDEPCMFMGTGSEIIKFVVSIAKLRPDEKMSDRFFTVSFSKSGFFKMG